MNVGEGASVSGVCLCAGASTPGLESRTGAAADRAGGAGSQGGGRQGQSRHCHLEQVLQHAHRLSCWFAK